MPNTAQTFDSQFSSRIYGHGRVVVSAPKHLHTLATHDSPTECIVLGQFETTGKQRLIYGLIGLGICLVHLFVFGLIWFWLWSVSAVLLLSSMFGDW